MVTDSAAPVEILLAEDNPADARLTREALLEGKIHHRLHIAHDGVDALDFLHRTGRHAEAPLPDLILLDLNMPRKDGREVLSDIKEDAGLSRIPVVVLTSSKAERDIAESYDLRANCFITKPVDFAQFMHVIRTVEEFWLTVVRLPPRP